WNSFSFFIVEQKFDGFKPQFGNVRIQSTVLVFFQYANSYTSGVAAQLVVKMVGERQKHRAVLPVFDGFYIFKDFAAARHILIYFDASVEAVAAFNGKDDVYYFSRPGFLLKIEIDILKTLYQ